MLRKLKYSIFFIIIIFTAIYYLNDKGHVNMDLGEDNLSSHHVEIVVNNGSKVFIGQQEDVMLFIEKMSMEEKIGQMIFGSVPGTSMTEEMKSLVGKYKIGGMIFFSNNLESPEQSIRLLNQIKANNEQNILPLFLGIDQEGGSVERLPELVKLPTNQKIGSQYDQLFAFELGELLGMQLNTFGFNLNFAPVLDVNSNPNNPVIGNRSFGDDTELVSAFGVQTMRGMKTQHIIPVIKHFPGHGDTSVDSHLELPLVDKSLAELQTLELIPFRKAIEAGADVVMIAHILLPQIDDELPASMSKEVVTKLLREQLNFDGIVITDDFTMKAITDNFDIGDAAVESVKAGTDIILVAHSYDELISVFDALIIAVNDGEISEERINESVQRIVQLKWEYEINNDQIGAIDIEGLNELIKRVLDE